MVLDVGRGVEGILEVLCSEMKLEKLLVLGLDVV